LLSYVLAHDEPNPLNSLAPRALDCLYLRPAPHSEHGGHECWHIATGKVINRRVVTPIPITASVIAAIEEAAKRENVKGFVLKSKHGVPLFDSSALAGVDYTQEALQNGDGPHKDPTYVYQSDHDEQLEDDTEGESGDSDDDNAPAQQVATMDKRITTKPNNMKQFQRSQTLADLAEEGEKNERIQRAATCDDLS
jgi:hypothetical protein